MIGFKVCPSCVSASDMRDFTVPSGIAVEGARYGGIGVTTSVVNYLAYSAALWALPALPPLAALVFGSAVAMVFSYLGYSRFVFDR